LQNAGAKACLAHVQCTFVIFAWSVSQASGLTAHCLRLPCPEATPQQLAAVHSPGLVDFVRAVSAGEPLPAGYPPSLLAGGDTYVNGATFTAARLAAGGAAAVAAAVAAGDARAGAAVVRPPGHHAESNVAMGFCFFNNAAVAARAAQEAGARRVLILDWDVHHGNGTQHIFEDDDSVLYMSLHRHDG
jgi:acetoin utilization deacetylase AcuC-like enzyme